MRCPECGSDCWRDEVDVGVGVYAGPWWCSDCGWDEDQAFPMDDLAWKKWLSEGPTPCDY